MVGFRGLINTMARVLPEVRKPMKRVSLTEKLVWTFLALAIYVFMSETWLYGYQTRTTPGQGSPLLLSIVFASRIGTLTTLGIGPIVTAGLILQLLQGADIIKLDLSKPEDRGIFTSASKIFTIAMTLFQAGAYVSTGYFGVVDPFLAAVIFMQLVGATVVIMLLDELLQKGWGLGSGISLFIVAGVALNIVWSLLSPIEPFGAGTGFQGLLLAIGQTIASGKGIESLVYRGQFPDLVGLASTTLVMIAIIYLESTKIEIPISYAKYSGYRAKYPIKLLYVSNVPVIFASTIFANIYYISSLLWNNYNRSNTNFFLNLIGRFNATEGGQPQPLSGLAYYTTSPRTLTGVAEDPVRALMYLAFMVVLSLAFSILWVEIGGLGSSRVAQQLVDAGMQVPGFRRSEGIIARVVDRYINVVTVLGGIFIGLIAGLADFFNVFGSGIGILLMVGILYQYYELLVRERVTEMYPALGRILGR